MAARPSGQPSRKKERNNKQEKKNNIYTVSDALVVVITAGSLKNFARLLLRLRLLLGLLLTPPVLQTDERRLKWTKRNKVRKINQAKISSTSRCRLWHGRKIRSWQPIIFQVFSGFNATLSSFASPAQKSGRLRARALENNKRVSLFFCFVSAIYNCPTRNGHGRATKPITKQVKMKVRMSGNSTGEQEKEKRNQSPTDDDWLTVWLVIFISIMT